jgi:hypothetical protein
MSMACSRRRTSAQIVFCLLWCAGIVVGLHKVTAYSNTSAELPSDNEQAELRVWPSESSILRAAGRPTLLVTLHPRCVCSRATLEELKRLLAQVSDPIQVELLLYQPRNVAEPWPDTDIVRQARSIPGVTVRPDPDGVEAERFDMPVSGYTKLFAGDGRALFAGGITRSRGHIGDNAGRSAIASLLADRQPMTSRTPVFGCAIRNQS